MAINRGPSLVTYTLGVTSMAGLLLALDGYRPQAPTALAAEEDGDMVRRLECGGCEHVGLDYRPYSRPGSYLAFAVCPACGRWEEV